MNHQPLSLIRMYKAADEVLGIKHGDRTRAKSSCVLRITFLLHIKGDDSARDKKRKRDDNNAKPDIGVNPQVNAKRKGCTRCGNEWHLSTHCNA